MHRHQSTRAVEKGSHARLASTAPSSSSRRAALTTANLHKRANSTRSVAVRMREEPGARRSSLQALAPLHSPHGLSRHLRSLRGPPCDTEARCSRIYSVPCVNLILQVALERLQGVQGQPRDAVERHPLVLVLPWLIIETNCTHNNKRHNKRIVRLSSGSAAAGSHSCSYSK